MIVSLLDVDHVLLVKIPLFTMVFVMYTFRTEFKFQMITRYLLETDSAVTRNVLRSVTKDGKFPGTFPVGLRRLSLNYIASKRDTYLVTAKLDGVRVLYVSYSLGSFLVDRSLNVYRVSNQSHTCAKFILDCEYVHDRYIMAFDCIALHGITVTQRTYETRYTMLCAFVQRGLHTDHDVLVKKVVPVSQVDCITRHLKTENVHLFTTSMDKTIVGDETNHEDVRVPVDGLVFMNSTSSYVFDEKFSLLKWKRTPSIDVLVHMNELMNVHCQPYITSFFWQYSNRKGRCTRRTFKCVHNVLDTEYLCTLKIQTSRYVCVEVVYDPVSDSWNIIRVRTDKSRSNSALTIYDTLWVIKEGITLDHMSMVQSVSNIETTHLNEISKELCTLNWVGKTWSETCDESELEVRLMVDGSVQVPESMVQSVVERLRTMENMVEDYRMVVDYMVDSTRVSDQGYQLQSIIKEKCFVQDIVLPDNPRFQIRLSMSYEHSDHINSFKYVDMDKVRSSYTLRREKYRHSFLHRNVARIDCTRVKTHNIQTGSETEHFEIEIEALHDKRYGCTSTKYGPIVSLVWRMLLYILELPVEETRVIY